MRYLPHTDSHRADMLKSIGVKSTDELFKDVPSADYHQTPFPLPLKKSEIEVAAHMQSLAAKNIHAAQVPSFLGAGAYRHHIPAAVDYLIQRGEFLTSYTPYQPEVAQGTLQALYEFQTLVCLITGMEVANASMYDGSTGTAEAVMMANRITGRKKVLISKNLHPHYNSVIDTHAELMGFECINDDVTPQPDGETSCVVMQTPDFFGHIHDVTTLSTACHAAGALLIIVVTEVLSLGALTSPGSMGADIVVCEGQSLGNPVGYGGPYVGLFATRETYMRHMPGRICGRTKDRDGKDGFVLTLATREQHIRREKATSNICTNAGLCALAFTIHLSLLGETGFRQLALLNHAKAIELRDALKQVKGVEVVNDTFFNEFTIKLKKPAAQVVEKLVAKNVLAGVPVSRLISDKKNGHEDLLLVTATELTTTADIQTLCKNLTEVLS